VHLLKLDAPPEPAWEPDQGWRVIDADGHVVNAGPRTILVAEFNLAFTFGVDEAQVPELGTGQERQ
jgi:hypothetical protein